MKAQRFNVVALGCLFFSSGSIFPFKKVFFGQLLGIRHFDNGEIPQIFHVFFSLEDIRSMRAVSAARIFSSPVKTVAYAFHTAKREISLWAVYFAYLATYPLLAFDRCAREEKTPAHAGITLLSPG